MSASEAAQRFGVNRHTLVAAAQHERVRARRVEAPGLGPNGSGFMFDEDELVEDLERLPMCGYEGCDRPALGPSGGCEAHGHVLAGARARGVKRPDIGPSISEAKRGKPRPDMVAALRDPNRQFVMYVARWGHRGSEYVKRATERLRRRLRGGRPPKAHLIERHARWLSMDLREDPELEELLTESECDRLRMIVLLDWQRHPEDWPRDVWRASRLDSDQLEPRLMRAAGDRVRKALQRGRTKTFLSH
jgi:hypothetical protein